MANQTFVAKNGLTANTANVYMSQLATNLTPTAGGLILIADGSGKVGTRTEAQIKSDIGAGVVETVTAGNGMTGGGTSSTVTVTMGTPTTLTVSTTDTVGATSHAHNITTSNDSSGGGAAILASDADGDLKVRDFETGGDLTVGDDASFGSDGAIINFGADNATTLTHNNGNGLILGGSEAKLAFTQSDFAESIYSSADGTLNVLSSSQTANFKVKFLDMFPVSLSDLDFDATDSDIDYLTANVTFKYTIYNITDLDDNIL